jgi:hypothetical protein
MRIFERLAVNVILRDIALDNLEQEKFNMRMRRYEESKSLTQKESVVSSFEENK